MIKLSWFVICLCVGILGQVKSQGIRFEQNLTWQQIKVKALKENKYIFIDCFATWCAPCKQMDRDVYSSASVGRLLNDRFICVKVQMDTTRNDGPDVISWRAPASDFTQQYKVNVFPMYLFFSPNGIIVHKSSGYQAENDFIETANDVLDPNRQYYTLLSKFQKGKLNYSQMPRLAVFARAYGDEDIASALVKKYTQHMSVLSGERLYTKQNIEFVKQFLSIRQPYFRKFFKNRNVIDSIMEKDGYVEDVLDGRIGFDIIQPYFVKTIKDNSDVNWDDVRTEVFKYHSATDIERIILLNKVKWSQYKANWPDYTQSISRLIKEYSGKLTASDLNAYAWTIFEHSSDTSELKSALIWSTRATELCEAGYRANYLDTKGNLLYKLGSLDEAIITLKKAVSISKELQSESEVEKYQKTILTMQRGDPTWKNKSK